MPSSPTERSNPSTGTPVAPRISECRLTTPTRADHSGRPPHKARGPEVKKILLPSVVPTAHLLHSYACALASRQVSLGARISALPFSLSAVLDRRAKSVADCANQKDNLGGTHACQNLTAQVFRRMRLLSARSVTGKSATSAVSRHRRGDAWNRRGSTARHSTRRRAGTGAYRIDVHHHFVPQFHIDSNGSRTAGRSAAAEMVGRAVDRGHGQGRHRHLDAVDPQPGIWYGNNSTSSRKLARELNEYCAKTVKRPSRPLRLVRRHRPCPTSMAA